MMFLKQYLTEVCFMQCLISLPLNVYENALSELVAK